jgi:hypothetical protein
MIAKSAEELVELSFLLQIYLNLNSGFPLLKFSFGKSDKRDLLQRVISLV